ACALARRCRCRCVGDKCGQASTRGGIRSPPFLPCSRRANRGRTTAMRKHLSRRRYESSSDANELHAYAKRRRKGALTVLEIGSRGLVADLSMPTIAWARRIAIYHTAVQRHCRSRYERHKDYGCIQKTTVSANRTLVSH